jgi:hypothetical protein
MKSQGWADIYQRRRLSAVTLVGLMLLTLPLLVVNVVPLHIRACSGASEAYYQGEVLNLLSNAASHRAAAVTVCFLSHTLAPSDEKSRLVETSPQGPWLHPRPLADRDVTLPFAAPNCCIWAAAKSIELHGTHSCRVVACLQRAKCLFVRADRFDTPGMYLARCQLARRRHWPTIWDD